MKGPQAEIDHSRTPEDDLGPAAVVGQKMADVAVAPLDRAGEVPAGEQLV